MDESWNNNEQFMNYLRRKCEQVMSKLRSSQASCKQVMNASWEENELIIKKLRAIHKQATVHVQFMNRS